MKRNRLTSGPQTTSLTGFTLIEVLIVVVILGVLAALAVPQFASAARETRDSNVKTTLHRVRTQISLYNLHHEGDFPSLANIADQMTLASNVVGDTAAPGTPGYLFGPYLLKFPVNAHTSGSTVGTGAVGDSDWYYEESTGHFHANDSIETRAY